MAKLTLLDLTQRILNDMSGDEVNDISDTIESNQVDQVIRDTYDEIIGYRVWPHLYQLIALTPTGSADPTHMDTAEGWVFIDKVSYNKILVGGTKNVYTELDYMAPSDFLDMVNARNSGATEVTVVTDPVNGVELNIINDRGPQFWTTFDDEVLVFDAYDSAVETNLQESKFQIWGNVEGTWTHTSVGIPDLPAKAFPYLLAEAKSTCFNTLMQVGNQKAEQQSRRQRVFLSREKGRNGHGMQFHDSARSTQKTEHLCTGKTEQ